jgi:hypothetical protein
MVDLQTWAAILASAMFPGQGTNMAPGNPNDGLPVKDLLQDAGPRPTKAILRRSRDLGVQLTVGDVARMTDEELLRIRGIGATNLYNLRHALVARGYRDGGNR